MHIVALGLSVLLALVMLASGVTKLRHAPQVVQMMASVHVSRSQTTLLGIIEVAATLGLLVGIWFTPLATAAAAGTVVYFIGAIIAHLRAHDRNLQAAAVLLLLAAATLTLLVVAL